MRLPRGRKPRTKFIFSFLCCVTSLSPLVASLVLLWIPSHFPAFLCISTPTSLHDLPPVSRISSPF